MGHELDRLGAHILVQVRDIHDAREAHDDRLVLAQRRLALARGRLERVGDHGYRRKDQQGGHIQ